MQFKLGEHTEDFWIPFNGSIVWDKEKSILSPYWAAGFVKEGYDDKANMVLKNVEVKLGVPGKIDSPDFSTLQAPPFTAGPWDVLVPGSGKQGAGEGGRPFVAVKLPL